MPRQLSETRYLQILWDESRRSAREHLDWIAIASGQELMPAERDLYTRGFAQGWRAGIRFIEQEGYLNVTSGSGEGK